MKNRIKENLKQKWYKQNVIVFFVSFIVLLSMTVAYAALMQALDVDGDIIIRAERDIRVTNITSNPIDCGYDQYNSRFMEDRVIVNLILPALNCTISYTVEVKNFSDKVMELVDIVQDNYSNPNIIYNITGYYIGDVLEIDESLTFTITFRYNPALTTLPADTVLGATIRFIWREHIPETSIHFAYKSECEVFIVPKDGTYLLEVWGAQGGNGSIATNPVLGGRGGYSAGQIRLDEGLELFICVGGSGLNANSATDIQGGFNGGGASRSNSNGIGHTRGSGGGSTDIRIGENTILHRVIVAGGGGGSGGGNNANFGAAGGSGGGLIGIQTAFSGNGSTGAGGTQINGGSAGHFQHGNTFGTPGSFFMGGISSLPASNGNAVGAGGGGGWYGGGAGGAAGGGGSGFIWTGQTLTLPQGYIWGLTSAHILTNTAIFNGTQSFPSPSGETITGREGNGHAKITFIN